jgi:hypothetical protein
MKNYPLKVIFDGTGDDRVYLAHGHHDPELFLTAVREYGATGQLTPPKHGRLRRIRPQGILWYLSFLTTRYGFRPYTLCFEGIPLDRSVGEVGSMQEALMGCEAAGKADIGDGLESSDELKPRYRLLEDGDKILPSD